MHEVKFALNLFNSRRSQQWKRKLRREKKEKLPNWRREIAKHFFEIENFIRSFLLSLSLSRPSVRVGRLKENNNHLVIITKFDLFPIDTRRGAASQTKRNKNEREVLCAQQR